MRFCSSIDRHPLPTAESTLLLFVSHLATCGLFAATIKVYLSAVRHMHVLATCGLSAATIKVYLSAVRHMHVTYGKHTKFQKTEKSQAASSSDHGIEEGS